MAEIPRMSWGDPGIQGFFTYRTITPLQRPVELGNKAVLTPEEAAEWATKENLRQNRDLIDDKKGGAGYAPGVISYNEFWYERGDDVIESRRTSLIYDPSKIDEPIFEYACHEGNIGLVSVLNGLLREDQERSKGMTAK